MTLEIKKKLIKGYDLVFLEIDFMNALEQKNKNVISTLRIPGNYQLVEVSINKQTVASFE